LPNHKTGLSKPAIELSTGKGKFEFENWGGSSIPVWTYLPEGTKIHGLPILIVMHGTKRDGDRYRDEWAQIAQKNNIIIIAPSFSKKDFPKSLRYNLGNVFDKEGREINKEEQWTFSTIEPLFDAVVEALGSNQKSYTLYGHSAGAQFVHRYLFYKPNARVKRYISANAGWYTLADMDEPYPYGLLGSGLTEKNLIAALQTDVVVLLGEKDTDSHHKHLRRTPEAMRQGPHRFARGFTFYKNAEKQAKKLGVPFNWKVVVVPNAVHSNAQMAIGAIEFIDK